MVAKRLPYGKEYLDWWYFGGGCEETFLGTAGLSDEIKKAITPADAPWGTNFTNYFEPKFSAMVEAYTWRSTEVLKLLPKTTFVAEGDSWKFYETDLTGAAGLALTSAALPTPFTTITQESGPTLTKIEQVSPSYMVNPWEVHFAHKTAASWQADPRMDPAWLKTYHSENFPNRLDFYLTQQADTVNNDGSAAWNIESIDRILSGYPEANTTYFNAATDVDLYWGKGTAIIDRAADTNNTFTCGAGTEGLDIASSPRVITLDMIDDVVAAIVPYSKRKRYIALTGPKTLNEIQNLIDPKQRFLDHPVDYQMTLQGVSTRKGAKTGFTVGCYVSNGIEIPFFTSRHVANETSDNRTGKAGLTGSNIGNIYLMELDNIEVRVAVPMTYFETPPAAMLTGDMFGTRYMLLYGAQLVAQNFRPHGAIKYLKKS